MRKRLKNQKLKRKAILVFVLLIFTIGLLFFSKKGLDLEEKPIECIDCNIVLVSFDTLRASNVGIYGYGRNTTPTIDGFARRGFTFTDAVSVTTWTLPSHMSWFTGVYPSQHKVLNKFTIFEDEREEITNLNEVSPNLRTLAEVFKESGYKTGGFTGGAGVHRQFGFDKGFDIYTDDKDFGGFSDSIPKALEWIKENKDEKLFVFLHGYDIHGQYVPEGGYDYRFVDFEYGGNLTGSKEEQKELREEGIARGQIFLTKNDVRFLTALYDEKIQRADNLFAQFIQKYQDLGLMNKTIFILTSDHGEELYEHGRIDHGHSLYEEQIKIPLVITVPGNTKSAEIEQQIRSIDLMPTIFDLVGIRADDSVVEQMAGVSLVPLIEGKKIQLDAFPETDYRYATFLRAIRTANRWKLILNLEINSEEAYNLNNDPEERKNIIRDGHKQVELLKQKLKAHLDNLAQTQIEKEAK